MAADGGELAEDEEERAEARKVEKERGVMAKAGEVEKETFKCSDCEKHYTFLHKLQHHKHRAARRRRWRRSRWTLPGGPSAPMCSL